MTTQNIIVQGNPPTIIVTPPSTPSVVIEKPIGINGREVEIQRSGDYLQWRYVGEESWTNILPLVDIKGDQGIQGIPGGTPIEVQNDGTYIQWRYVGEAEWINLVLLADITGEQGIPGTPGIPGADGSDGSDGEAIMLQKTTTHIQWKYTSDVTWTDLVALSEITGATGEAGTPGLDGEEIQLQVSATHIQWKYASDTNWSDLIALSAITGADGAAGTPGADGADGTPVEMGVSATHVQWRYVGAAEWTDLIALSAITGTDGEAGTPGTDGEEIMIQVNATHIQWKYESDVTWNDLIALSAITGADGEDGTNGTNGTDGVDGKTILNGTIDPTTEGVDGDFYINTATLQIFGPKTAGVWGTGTNITGPAGADGTDGVSIVWQGSLATAPANPVLNWGYYNTTDGKSYIWDGDSWEIIAQDGSGGGGNGVIDDTVTAIDKTWSSTKIDGLLGDVEAALDAIIGA